MVIRKILKKLTPERIKKEVEAIQKVKLPPELKKWVKEYEKVGERPDFIWKWTYLGMKKITLPSVTRRYKKSVWITKTISIILNTLVDDLADKRKNKTLLEAALDICSPRPGAQIKLSRFSKKDRGYLGLIKKLWKVLNKTIRTYPRYGEFKELFLYDYQQFLNSMKYSYVINKNPDSINLTECEVYSAHNMQGVIALTIDLMCSPKFNKKELGVLREIGWRAQRMGRIGNSITTWEREAHESDFSSEVFAYSIEKGVITAKDLQKKNKDKLVMKIKKSGTERYFLKRWESYYNNIRGLSKKIKSTNIKNLLSGLESLIIMHLSSRGLK